MTERCGEGRMMGEEMGSSGSESMCRPQEPTTAAQHSAGGDGPLYYAKGLEVWKRSIATRNPDRTTSYTLGFCACVASEWVGEEGARAIAAMLTMAERFEERGEPREPIGCPMPGACACPAENSHG